MLEPIIAKDVTTVEFVIPENVTPSLETPFDGVVQFHEVYGAPNRLGQPPALLDPDRAKVRYEFLQEEMEELADAIAAGDIVEIVDALGDIIYFANGFGVEMGVNMDDIGRIIQLSNLTKLGEDGQPILSRGYELDGKPLGKVLKGPNYQEPQEAIRMYLTENGWKASE